MFILKKIFFKKPPHIMGVENFNGGAKYEKTNFNLEKKFLCKTAKHF